MHLRICDSRECSNPATHYLVWTAPQFFCEGCASKMLVVGDAIGFNTAKNTLRPLTTKEMLLEDDTDAQEESGSRPGDV